MKSIIISIKPEWIAKILNGEKTIEIRKTAPKCDLPIDVYIYCTNGNSLYDLRKENIGIEFGLGKSKSNNIMLSYPPIINGKVVVKFTLKEVELIYWRQDCVDNPDINDLYVLVTDSLNDYELEHKSCMKRDELEDYIGCELDKYGYAWHISDLVIFDEPRELGEFFTCTEKQCIYGDCHKYMHCRKYLKRQPKSWCYVEATG